MTFFYVLLALTTIAFFVPFLLKLAIPHKVTWGEVCGSLFVSLIVTLICTGLVFKSLHNTELVHGYVTDKKQVKVSCEHSYSCNCVTVSNGNGGTTTTCSTCYDHSHDFDWRVYTTIGSYNIERIDRQGKKEPERYTIVNKNDPVTDTSSYIDYVSGSASSLFNLTQYATEENKAKYRVPAYPKVFDYYNTNLVINMGAVTADVVKDTNTLLRKSLNSMGSKKQVNVIVVFTKHDRNFGNYLQYAWNNGRKNDRIVVIGVDSEMSPTWVYSFGWSKNQMVNIGIRDDIQTLQTITPDTVVDAISKNVNKHFSRTPMEEYKYLATEVEVSVGVVIFCIILQLLGNIGFAMFIVNNNTTNGFNTRIRYRRK
jgi:hypothetical protein